MFNNIGNKIKILTIVTFVLCSLASITIGIILVCDDEGIGWVLIFAGPIVFWIGSFLMYGFGELVDSASKIAKSINKGEKDDVNLKTETINEKQSSIIVDSSIDNKENYNNISITENDIDTQENQENAIDDNDDKIYKKGSIIFLGVFFLIIILLIVFRMIL